MKKLLVFLICCITLGLSCGGNLEPRVSYSDMAGSSENFPPEVLAYTSFLRTSGGREINSGGGVCVQQEEDFCYVLTAAHVCTIDPDMQAVDINGNHARFEYVDVNGEYDLCLLKVYNVYDAEMNRFMSGLLPYSETYNYAAPLGLFHPNPGWLLPRFEGRFSGWDGGALIISSPVQGGSSGSAMYYQGAVVGLVIMRYIRFEHLSIVTPPELTIEFLLLNDIDITIVDPGTEDSSVDVEVEFWPVNPFESFLDTSPPTLTPIR